MQNAVIVAGTPRRSRVKSFAATLGVAAVLAGVVIPAALPVGASAVRMRAWCEIWVGAKSGAEARGERDARRLWLQIATAFECG
jgi:hypothetical protein